MVCVPTVLIYVTSLRKVFTVHVIVAMIWVMMEEHVMVCFNMVSQHYRCHYFSYVTNDITNIQLHGTYVNLCIHTKID